MQQRRGLNYENHSRSLDHTIKSLEDQIQLTIYNYENILQTEKKNSSERSQFLLYLIQSLRTRHLQQIEAVSLQIHNAEAERQSVQSMQKQMEKIGVGLDQIMEESQKLKQQNENLVNQLKQEEHRQKQLDQEIQAYQKQLEDCRMKIDNWELIKVKWNRHKKELIEMIEDAQKVAQTSPKSEQYGSQNEQSLCLETGQQRNTCQHCQKKRIEQLRLKYSAQFRRSN